MDVHVQFLMLTAPMTWVNDRWSGDHVNYYRYRHDIPVAHSGGERILDGTLVCISLHAGMLSRFSLFFVSFVPVVLTMCIQVFLHVFYIFFIESASLYHTSFSHCCLPDQILLNSSRQSRSPTWVFYRWLTSSEIASKRR